MATKRLDQLDLGDTIIRTIGGLGGVEMELLITEFSDDNEIIFCGPWAFDITTGAEIDDALEWGPPPLITGSHIVSKL